VPSEFWQHFKPSETLLTSDRFQGFLFWVLAMLPRGFRNLSVDILFFTRIDQL